LSQWSITRSFTRGADFRSIAAGRTAGVEMAQQREGAVEQSALVSAAMIADCSPPICAERTVALLAERVRQAQHRDARIGGGEEQHPRDPPGKPAAQFGGCRIDHRRVAFDFDSRGRCGGFRIAKPQPVAIFGAGWRSGHQQARARCSG
jgi:hypothetical protein